MNILVFSWRDPKHPLAGGAEQVMHEHMKGWIEAGHSVTLFTSTFPGALDKENLDGVKILRKGSQYLTVQLMAFFWYSFSKHERFDLVIDQFHGWSFFTPLYVRKPKLAVIQELTREVWFKYPLPLGLNYILGPIGFIVEPLFFLFYKDVPFMTGSESAKKELLNVGIEEKNIIIVPHGVILNLPKKLPAKEKKKTIIFLGALAKDKGIEDAIKVFSILGKNDDYQFWVVGKGDRDYVEFLKKMTASLGLTKRVKFFGFVNQEDKFVLLAKSHVMVNPSIREGWGLVNIEANAVGTPVVAYNSQGLIDSIKDGLSGIICRENTPQMLAQQIHDLVTDKNRFAFLAKGALAWSKNFTWEKSRQLSLVLISKIFSGSHPVE